MRLSEIDALIVVDAARVPFLEVRVTGVLTRRSLCSGTQAARLFTSRHNALQVIGAAVTNQ